MLKQCRYGVKMLFVQVIILKDNMIAHYGVASDFNDHRPTYLGSVSAP